MMAAGVSHPPHPRPKGRAAPDADHAGSPRSGQPVIVKKYANRRLYDTRSKTYCSLALLAEMVREGVDFVVRDGKTGEDITGSVLTQIICNEESLGQNLLPTKFLRQLIGFYGDGMQALLPAFLELSLDSFAQQQELLCGQIVGAIANPPGMRLLEDQVRQNLALFDIALKVCSTQL